MFHLALHFVIPLIVAVVLFRRDLRVAYLWMLGSMVIDLDHLLADPIYDPERCSIGFHPLHSAWAIALWVVMFAVTLPHETGGRIFGAWRQRLNYLSIGLLIHIGLDGSDCIW